MILKNQKGMALITVLFTLMVVSLLGTTVYYASNQETLSAEHDEMNTQAYYFAQSGVEMAVGLIKGGLHLEPDDTLTYYGKIDGTFTQQEPSEYNIRFKISVDEDKKEFLIDSLGVVSSGLSAGGFQAKNGQKYRYPINGFGNEGGSSGGEPIALFANDSLYLQGSPCIYGSVITNTVASDSIYFYHEGYIRNGSLYLHPNADSSKVVYFKAKWGAKHNIPDGQMINLTASRSFPLPAFPDFPDGLPYTERYDTSHWRSDGLYEINGNGYFGTLGVYSNRTMIIRLSGGDRILRVKNLDIQQGDLKLVGQGRLILYVEDSFNLGGSSIMNPGGESNSLVIYYGGSKALDFGGNTRVYGSIYAKNANVSIGGSNNIKGHIITGGTDVSVFGAANAYPSIVYAPNATVEVRGSGDILGTVVSKRCDMIGAATITADSALDMTFFKSLNWGLAGAPSLTLTDNNSTPSNTSWRKSGRI